MARKFTNVDITENASFSEALSSSVNNQPEEAPKKRFNTVPVEDNVVNGAASTEQPEQPAQTKEVKKPIDEKAKKRKIEFLRLVTDMNCDPKDWQNVRVYRENLDAIKEICTKLGEPRNVTKLVNNLIGKFLKDYDDVIKSINVKAPKKEEPVDEEALKAKRLNELYEKMF